MNSEFYTLCIKLIHGLYDTSGFFNDAKKNYRHTSKNLISVIDNISFTTHLHYIDFSGEECYNEYQNMHVIEFRF